MRVLSRPRAILWWDRATWIIPVVGTIAGVLLAVGVSVVDEAEWLLDSGRATISPAAATTVLSAVGGGMVTFTGFVFSFVMLLVQFGSTAYSPRTVTYFLRARTVQWILGLYLATITFSFVSVVETGSLGRQDFAPATAVFVSLLMLVASLLGFVVLLHSIGRRIRVDAVLAAIGRSARRQLRGRGEARPGVRTAAATGATPGPAAADGTVATAGVADPGVIAEYLGRPGQIVAIDARQLVRLAREYGCTIQVVPRIGDAVVPGTPVARVLGRAPALDRRISRSLVVDVERSLLHDPLYALRLLVDVAVRALSPAVNDPTTAVRALDEIESVLRTAVRSEHLGALTLPAGPGSVVLSRPSWDEVVDLALIEVLECGRGQVQVDRRLLVLLDDLIADVGPSLRPVLVSYRDQVQVADRLVTGRARAIARVGDRQGLGGSG